MKVKYGVLCIPMMAMMTAVMAIKSRAMMKMKPEVKLWNPRKPRGQRAQAVLTCGGNI